MKVLFIIDNISDRGGASSALRMIIQNNHLLDAPIIFCRNNYCKDKYSIPIIQDSAKNVLEYYITNGYQCIHYFKSDASVFFYEVIHEIKKLKIDIPIINTICQRPSFKAHLLTPFEITNSDLIVFIDKAALNDSLYSFIPKEKKAIIYCGVSDEEYEETGKLTKQRKENCEHIVIGRAGSPNKCPHDMFEVFDRLIDPKSIVILGGASEWMNYEKGKRHNYNIELLDSMPYEQYLQKVNEFDIFLYHLPSGGYSSLDATLGHAMLLKKPCVYMGPEAPKERFLQGYNGFIAETKEELIIYTNLLIQDINLRKEIGTNARETTIKCFSIHETVNKYNYRYQRLVVEEERHHGGVSVFFYIYYSIFYLITLRKRIINKFFRLCRIKYQIPLYK